MFSLLIKYIFILIIYYSFVVRTAVPNYERSTLVDIYTATGGAAWVNNQNWLVGDPCDNDWFGISCNAANTTVTVLNINNNNLQGIFPTHWELFNVSTIDIGFNGGLSGSIFPSNWSDTSVGDIYLQFDGFTDEFPDSWTNWPITRIDVRDNNIFGTLPDAWNTMTGLNFLGIGDNPISGSLPSSWSSLSLVTIAFGSTNINGTLPPSWSAMTSLREFYGAFTQLGGVLPDSWSALNLIELRLRSNMLEGSIPASWSSQNIVNTLDLRDNNLCGDLPPFLQSDPGYPVLLQGNQFNCPAPVWCASTVCTDCTYAGGPCVDPTSSTSTPTISESPSTSFSSTLSITSTPSISFSSTLSITSTSSISFSSTISDTPSPSISISTFVSESSTPSPISSISISPSNSPPISPSISSSALTTNSPTSSISISPSISDSVTPSISSSISNSPSISISSAEVITIVGPTENPIVVRTSTPSISSTSIISASASSTSQNSVEVEVITTSFDITSQSQTVNLLSNTGTTVGEILVPPNVIDISNAIEVSYINNPNEGLLNEDFSSIVVNITPEGYEEEERVNLNSPLTICLEDSTGDIDDNSCLAFYDVEFAEWVCEDSSLEKKESLYCGNTDHLTSFVLLLGENSDSDTVGLTIFWISIGLLVLAIFFVIFGVIWIEILYRKKLSKRKETMRKLHSQISASK